MSFRPRFLSALAAIFAFAGAATQIASCGLDPYGTQPPEQVKTCSTDANCDDQNPCTIDQCLPDKTCTHTNATNAPLTQQIAGDCRRDDCLDGEVVPTNDDADIADDNELCTTDGCSNGNPSHTALAEGTTCTLGMSPGNCVMGVCTVVCSPTKPCDDSNPCTEDSCNASVGTCTFSPLDGLPTPGFQEPVGDCKVHICSNGVDAPINDDADVPDDMNSCTQNVCSGGVPMNPGVSIGMPCVVGQPDVCDGQGACVKCNVSADCVLLPPDDDCQKRTCINKQCGQTFTTAGIPTTATPPQILGDCKRIVCDGNGATKVENFDADLPNDNNSCTQNICMNGTPSNPLEAQDFVCGANQVCDDMGNCVGCNDATQCVGTDDFCKTRTCINNICGYDYTAAGTDLPTGQTSQDCKVIECDGMGTAVQNPDGTDKPVDGNQCTQDVCTAGMPSNPFEMVNVACNQSGGTVCNGAGACKKANSATCAAGIDCLSGFCVDGVCCNASCGATCKSCNVPGSVGTCVDVPKAVEDLPGCTGTNSCDGAGTCKKDDAQGCANATDCVSSFCIDGVCCTSACTTACRVCNAMGSVGVCTTITSGEDPVATPPCMGTAACDASGLCKTKDGNTCTLNTDCISGQCYDGVCCNVACSGTCKSCNIAGAVGICSNVAAGEDDVNGVPSCSGANQSCDGLGTCKKENAQGCSTNTECLSNFCVDNVCCNSACTGICQACIAALTGSGSDGTCGNVAIATDPQNECANGSCNGAAACKFDLGAACSIGAECLSTFCVDGYCCNTACTGTCQTCSALIAGPGSNVTNGTCGPIVSGNDPDNECANGSCDGAATCKLALGVACDAAMMGADCLSGFCADGVCCNSACGNSDATDCQACSIATGASVNGTCAPLAANTTCRAPAGSCDVAETCNGSATACPADTFIAAGTTCRASADLCDVEETCTGSSAACPADTLSPSGTTCRPSAGTCDVDETCSGMSAACPADTFSASGTVCRIAGGVCDVAETCTGMAAACPADALSPSGTTCRPAADTCDVAELCTGTDVLCPSDTFEPATTECRPSSGDCDVAESCTGLAAACPTDGFLAPGTVCRMSIDTCDATETCDGSSAACPIDAFQPNSTLCRPSLGDCDVQENCSGVSAMCPPDDLEPATTVCRGAAGICDVAELCTGMDVLCPADTLEPATTECRPSAGDCDVAESCTGLVAECPSDGFLAPGSVCRMSIDTCDATETCDGSSAACPIDAFLPDSTVCSPALGDCDVEEFCTGSSTACPADLVKPSATVCRLNVDLCDATELCDGVAVDCPTDAFAPVGTVCAPQICIVDTETSERTCDGAGTCNPGTPTSCGNYACNIDVCGTTCTTDTECAGSFTCVGNICQ